jgi:HAMP domain-containing protein
MPTEQSTGNGRKSKGRSGGRMAIAHSDSLDTDQLLAVLIAVRKGDFSLKMPMSQVGIAGKISDALNDIIDLNRETTKELERVSQAVGKEGKITQRAHLHGAAGAWAASVNSVNTLIGDLVQPTSEVARVIGAVAKGDLSQTMSLEIEGRQLMGEFLRIGKTVNAMVDQLSSFASEVTRVAREVGTEGKLGGQARVKGVGGTWKDLTDNVNSMAGNLTAQVRNIAQVTTAVANGDLSKKITVDVKGEILELKNTINTMVDQLSSFSYKHLRAHLAGHAGDLRRKRVELVHHGIDGVLELEDFAFDVDGDLLGKVAARHGGGHLGDIADLAGEILRHQVDVVGEVRPGTGDAGHLRLAA